MDLILKAQYKKWLLRVVAMHFLYLIADWLIRGDTKYHLPPQVSERKDHRAAGGVLSSYFKSILNCAELILI